jgi:hypothetical protein
MACCQRSQELQEVPKEGKRGEGTWIKLSGEREVDFNRTKLTLTVPNFDDVGYRAADIPRLRVCYTPFVFDIGTRGT